MLGALLNDRYQLNDQLGRGGMGVVYRAHDRLLQRAVAIKVVSDTTLDNEGRSQLLREARLAAALEHPNIVTVFDVGEGRMAGQPESVAYIVMQLVEGRSLRGFRPGSLEEALDISLQLSAAIEQIHRQDLIHCDLKPENVLVTTGGRVVLVDFGLARRVGRPRPGQDGLFSGTLAYLAPELILGKEAGPQSDLYALGVIFYEIFAGKTPFDRDNQTAVLFQHLYGPIIPPSVYNEDIPPALDRLILSLLNKRPVDRSVNAEQVRLALQLLQDGELLPAYSPVLSIN